MNRPTILDEIVQSKMKRLEEQKEAMSLDLLKRSSCRSDRDFRSALLSPQPGFILECKKASPSKGLIRPDFDLVNIASTYGKHVSAISVLTESDYFQGSLSNLGIVRNNAAQPILAKDFFVDPYQVYQAWHFGADAILLILAIVDDRQWTEMSQLASSLGMDVLTEISNREEQQRAVELNAPIVGINNRNLRDMSIDLQTTRQLSQGLPDGTIVVSESGYHTHRQVRQMSDRADAFLIGSSLMAESNLAAATKRIIFGDCKVCGLTRNTDAVSADDAGAVYGGVVLADSSPRKVTCQQIEGIFEGTDLIRVGVFQDHSLDQILDVVSECRLDVIQLHGDESPELIQQLENSQGFNLPIWKAVGAHQLAEVSEGWFRTGVERLVVDNHQGLQKGGTGNTFDWSQIPDDQKDRIILAGGIGGENVRAAVAVGCAGIDMNSKLEDEPGIKSASKIADAFAKIREYQHD